MKTVLVAVFCAVAALAGSPCPPVAMFSDVAGPPPGADPFAADVSTGFPYSVQRPSGETVSVHRLEFKPLRKAVRALVKAHDLAKRGRREEAIGKLEEAVLIDPNYADAHNNLAAQYLMEERSDQALAEFRRAIQLDPATSFYYSNLGFALVARSQPSEAAEAATHALKLDAGNFRAHMVLGLSLAMFRTSLPKAVRELEIAARDLPQAKLALAVVYKSTGGEPQATEWLERYFKGNPTADHKLAQRLMREVEQNGTARK